MSIKVFILSLLGITGVLVDGTAVREAVTKPVGCKRTQAGREYDGYLNTTVCGYTCQRWADQSPHTHTQQLYEMPDKTFEEASNYCRNPDSDWWSAGPWCYTTDPNKRWDHCDVKLCTGSKEGNIKCSEIDANASCKNTKGVRTCTCNKGFEGDAKTCSDIDECSKENDCSSDASCKNTKGSYTCTCNKGFEGDGKTCCPEGNNCSPHAICKKEKAYFCTCSKSSNGEGKYCRNDSECLSRIANCEETPYTCTCKEGYEGDGRTCKQAK